jgi:putative molybdopterin biosynthesis protein
MKQDQFLEVVDRDEAESRWQSSLLLRVLESEIVPLDEALERVLAEDISSTVDVPSFDRSNMDGFAIRCEDSYGASEERPARLALNEEEIRTGIEPRVEVVAGTASVIATGAIVPRGANAVVPVELTDTVGRDLLIRTALVPGSAISFAGSDMAIGEIVLHKGAVLTSRDTGVLAAIGVDRVPVVRRPRVGVLSTGDEIVAPGSPMVPGGVYDSNGRILVDALREIGADAVFLGSFRDEFGELRAAVERGIVECDLLLLSGGTSKGEGDLCYRVVSDLEPGIQGFPTSAVFTFHEFVAPVVRQLGGRPRQSRRSQRASLASRVRSELGRLEYLLVNLVHRSDGDYAAFPMGKGSGSVTTFSRADGFVRLERTTEIVEAGTQVEVTLLGRSLSPADLVIVGSHCTGLDVIAAAYVQGGRSVKVVAAGSLGGLDAARRGECDIAPIHLLDPETGEYNRPFLGEDLELIEGYRRMQGVVTRMEEEREVEELLADESLRMVNRNRSSGTRIVIDRLLGDRRPDGYTYEPRSHQAVAAAVAQGRADFGVTIEPAALSAGLRFRPLCEEHYDFVVPRGRLERQAVKAFQELLSPGSDVRARLQEAGFSSPSGTG